MSAPHATAREDDVRALLDLLLAALRLAEKDGTTEGEALNRIIRIAHDKAKAVMGMWEAAFAATTEQAPATPARDHASTQRLESAVMDCEGDVLLLQAAIEDATRGGTEIRGGWYTRLDLNPDQLLAMSHAAGRMRGSVNELSRAFYGREGDA